MLQMKKINKNLSDATRLRQLAEDKYKKKHSGKEPFLTESETNKLSHELGVHQIELEMQAEELRLARDEAEIAAEKYTMLYDFAPVGYFTLDHYNTIIELNFSGARMLSESRNDLANSDFSLFVTHDTRPIFNDFMQKIIKSDSKQTCEVRLTTTENPAIFVHIEGIVSREKNKYLVVVVDISDRKLLEEAQTLKYKVKELEYANSAMVGRELKMIELKKEINALLLQMGKEKKYFTV